MNLLASVSEPQVRREPLEVNGDRGAVREEAAAKTCVSIDAGPDAARFSLMRLKTHADGDTNGMFFVSACVVHICVS